MDGNPGPLAAMDGIKLPPRSTPRDFTSLQTDPRYANETSPHGSWVGAVELDEDDILLLGSLGLDAHVWLKGNQLVGWHETDSCEWFIARETDHPSSQNMRMNLPNAGERSNKPAPQVWCSWYSLYTAIDRSILFRAFDKLGDLPFDVLQVDDGWQTSIGDWEANGKFPSGMNALAEKIKSTGRKAGLWLAPLIAVESSRLFREHPDWFCATKMENLSPRDSIGANISTRSTLRAQRFSNGFRH
ncbi:MAG: alpha-galactosidase [Anaerolineales bacterium]